MSTEFNPTRNSDDSGKHEDLIKRIKCRRRNIQSFVNNLEPKGVLLTNINIICSALATFLTAAPAAGGKPLMDALGASNPDTIGWRILLALAALLSLASAILANLYRSQDIATHLSKARACDARLDGLEMLLELRKIELDDAATKYNQILGEIDYIPDESALGWVTGEIKEPQSDHVVAKRISCSGWAEGLGLNLHLWLVVEIEGIKGIWPKEGEILTGNDRFWRKVIWEEGTKDAFSLSLFVANEKANRRLRAWLDKCDNTGNYPELRRPPGMQRVDRIDGLRR